MNEEVFCSLLSEANNQTLDRCVRMRAKIHDLWRNVGNGNF